MFNLNRRDYKVLEGFYRVGIMRKEQLYLLGLSNNRIETYIKEDIIKKVHSQISQETFYQLSYNGLKIAKKLFKGRSRLVVKMTPDKSILLTDEYFLLSDTEKESWIVDIDVRNLVKNEKYRLIFPHAIYKQDDGKMKAIFVKTRSYKNKDIDTLAHTCGMMPFNDLTILILR